MYVYDAMAQAFLDEGVDTVFSLMGDGNMYWMTAFLDRAEIRNFHVRHENAGVAMADGYARTTGKVGVVTVTSGPGLTQAMTAIIGAARYNVPMVIFAGDTIPGDTKALQYLDHRAFAQVCGVHCEAVVTPGRALEAVSEAFHRARTLREPVILSVPLTMHETVYPREYEYTPSADLATRESRPVPAPETLDKAAGLIAWSRKPVILVGIGGTSPAAITAIEELGERVGALYATSLLAKGTLDDSPWTLGLAGTFSLPQTEAIMKEADLVIGVGATLNKYTRQEGYLFPNARVIQIIDKPVASAPLSLPATLNLYGDAALTVEALVQLLDAAEHRAKGLRPSFVRAEYDPFAENTLGVVGPDEDALDPRIAVAELEAAIPDGAIVMHGAGHFWSFTNKGLSGRGGRQFFTSMGFGSIGQTLPMAIGAAAGNPDRAVVMIDGDSSAMVHLLELDGAVREQLKLLTVVLDDDAMGAELHRLREHGVEHADAALVPTPDLAGIVRSVGGTGATVRTVEELRDRLRTHDWKSVALIDIKISQSIADTTSVQANVIKEEVPA